MNGVAAPFYKRNPINKCKGTERNIKLTLGKHHYHNCCRQNPADGHWCWALQWA